MRAFCVRRGQAASAAPYQWAALRDLRGWFLRGELTIGSVSEKGPYCRVQALECQGAPVRAPQGRYCVAWA